MVVHSDFNSFPFVFISKAISLSVLLLSNVTLPNEVQKKLTPVTAEYDRFFLDATGEISCCQQDSPTLGSRGFFFSRCSDMDTSGEAARKNLWRRAL